MGNKAKAIDKAVEELIKSKDMGNYVKSGKLLGYCGCGRAICDFDIVGESGYRCYGCRVEGDILDLSNEKAPLDKGIEIDEEEATVVHAEDLGISVKGTVDAEEDY